MIGLAIVLLVCLTTSKGSNFAIVDQAGSKGHSSGLLLYSGGTVCDDGFDNTAANAICSDLGYKSSGSEWSSEYKWVIQSGYIIKLDDVNCRSKSWSSCTYSLYNDCSHYEDVFLSCVGTGSEEFKIVDRNGVEVGGSGLLLFNSGTVCDDGFNQNAADAICSLLGYPNSGSEWTSGEVRWSIQSTYFITLDDVNCQTSSWSSCTYSETDNCGHGQDVFLTCFGSDSEFKIVDRNGNERGSSGLLLYKSGTVCNDGFNQNAANAICFLLGYPASGSEWTSGSKWSIQSRYPIKLDDVNCRTNSWFSCTYSEIDNCGHSEDVFLTCSGSNSGNFRLVDMEGHTADRTGLLLYESGTVCNDEFDDNAANAICSLMGYAAIGSEWSSGSKWGIQYTYGIALDDVECSTRSWSSCTYSEHHDCSHYEDVFLTCSEAGSEFKIVNRYGNDAGGSGLLLYNGGTVCDNNFDQNVASAICSFQGYTGDDSEWSSGQKWDIQYSYSITLDNLNCPSTYWSSCTYSEYPNCDHSEDVFLTCYDASLELSIVGRDGADGASSGLLHYKGGTVCDHGFDLNSAYAICSVLGFPENSTQWFSGNQWSIQSTYGITLGDVICRTSSWSSCTYSESPNCDHNEDVFLTCADEVSEFKIVNRNGDEGSSSGLLLYKSGTVCDDGFSQNAADAICSLLGYPSNGSKWTSGSKWSIQSDYRIKLDDVNCWTNSWSICTYTESPNCDHSEDVFLTCSGSDSGGLSAGGIVGIIVAVLAVIFGVFLYRKRKRNQSQPQLYRMGQPTENNVQTTVPAPIIPTAPEHENIAHGRTDPDAIAPPALGADNLAPPSYTDANSVSEYGEEVPTYEDVMANEQKYDVAPIYDEQYYSDSLQAPLEFIDAAREGGTCDDATANENLYSEYQ